MYCFLFIMDCIQENVLGGGGGGGAKNINHHVFAGTVSNFAWWLPLLMHHELEGHVECQAHGLQGHSHSSGPLRWPTISPMFS